MNVIVSNRQKEIIDNANIDAIKDLNGLFSVDDLINKFKNYFFSKMILDATSVVNFASKQVLTTLADDIGAEKLIILLPSNPEPPMEFKKLLIDLKIYNFTNNIDDVVRFIETPNTYEDAMKLIDNSYDNGMYVDNSIKDNNFDNNGSNSMNNNGMNISNDNNSNMNNNTNNFNTNANNIGNMINNNNNGYATMNHSSLGDMLSNFSINNEVENNNSNSNNNENNGSVTENNDISNNMNINLENNMDSGLNNNIFNNLSISNNEMNNDTVANSNGSGNTFLITDGFDDTHYNEQQNPKMIIGVRDVTLHAGSTSLIYMLHKVAVNTLKRNVLSVEIGRNDFRLFRDKNMISVDVNEIGNVIESAKEDIIFVDLNDFDGDNFCTDVIYLVEPSTIMLNRLMANNKNAFMELKNRKVVLNKSLLSHNDMRTLASEAGLEFFYNIEPLNDRTLNDSIRELLNLLGIK